MSATKRQLKKAQEKPLPKTLTLTCSQAVSLSALSKQIQELNTAIEASMKARQEVLQEISKGHAIAVDTISSHYRFDGQKLFLP